MSLYYPPKENGFKLCIWNGCSQFGDFVALGLGYFLVEVCHAKPQSLILTICGLLLVMIAVNWFFLVLPQRERTSSKVTRQQSVERPPEQANIEAVNDEHQPVSTAEHPPTILE